MFAARYFAPRFFAPRYYAKVGAEPVVAVLQALHVPAPVYAVSGPSAGGEGTSSPAAAEAASNPEVSDTV